MNSYQHVMDLKASIMKVVRKNDYELEVLIELLDPIGEYITNPLFVSNLRKIVNTILEDRDGNNKFTLDDLELLGKDPIAITSLISTLLLVIGTIPQVKLKYNADATEELIFKVMAYVFLVIVPKEIGKPWSREDKNAILDVTINIYQLAVSSQMTKDILATIVGWFKKKGLCKCMSASAEEHHAAVVEKHLPQLQYQLANSIQNNKDKLQMQKDIIELKQQIAKMK